MKHIHETFTEFLKEANYNKGYLKLNGKKVDISSIEIEDIDTRDYPDFADAYISYAEYSNGKELTDSELEELQDEYPEIPNELIHDNQLYL